MTAAKERERILNKAYELWEAEGRPTGRDMEHWFQAEILISQELSKAKPAAKASAKAKGEATAKSKEKAPAKSKEKAPAKAKAPARKASAKSKS